jgi:hypothetical protein
MTRINFEVSDEQNKAIKDLLAQTGLKTRVQLFNTAFTLLEWTVQERENGRAIVAMDERTGTYKELVMPGLPTPVKQSPIRKNPTIGEHLNGLALLVKTDEQARELAEVAQSFDEPLPPRLLGMFRAKRSSVAAAALQKTKP